MKIRFSLRSVRTIDLNTNFTGHTEDHPAVTAAVDNEVVAAEVKDREMGTEVEAAVAGADLAVAAIEAVAEVGVEEEAVFASPTGTTRT